MNHDLRKPDVLDGPFALAALRARNTVEPKTEPFRFRMKTDEPSPQIRIAGDHEGCPLSGLPSTKRVFVPIYQDGKKAILSLSEVQYRQFKDAMAIAARTPPPTRWQRVVSYLKGLWPW